MEDGLEEPNSPKVMSTSHFYQAGPGDKLTLLDARYEFSVATYAAKVEDKWLYTYDYAPDQAWVVYNGDLSANGYRRDDYVFGADTYFRICLRSVDGKEFHSEDINDILTFKRKDTLRFALLSDSHYNVNGTWDVTAGAIWVAGRRRKIDGIIHLGDLTDGMMSLDVCRDYVNTVLGDLRAVGLPVWVTLGNHDCNYFKNNLERMTLAEQCALYLGREEPRYFIDFPTHKLRMFFLDSFDPGQTMRYGYSPECAAWLEETMDGAPESYMFLLFSHIPPTARLQYWVKSIRGEDILIPMLKNRAGRILAWINGHNHADHLDNTEGFPIISIGNAKCEAFTERKPEGFITPERKLGNGTQELWDILTVDTEGKTLRFKRQGAGKDRLVVNGRAEWV